MAIHRETIINLYKHECFKELNVKKKTKIIKYYNKIQRMYIISVGTSLLKQRKKPTCLN